MLRSVEKQINIAMEHEVAYVTRIDYRGVSCATLLVMRLKEELD